MTNEERKMHTNIGEAEIRKDNVERRDRLVKAAQDAGFVAEYTEAIGVSFSGATTPSIGSLMSMSRAIYLKKKKSRRERNFAMRGWVNSLTALLSGRA